MFKQTLAGFCSDEAVLNQYSEIATILSRMDTTSCYGGMSQIDCSLMDFRDVFDPVSFVEKLQNLSNKVVGMCSDSSLANLKSQVQTLAFATDVCLGFAVSTPASPYRVSSMESSSTTTTTTTTMTTGTTTTYSVITDGYCSTKGYVDTNDVFASVRQSATNPVKALVAFGKLTTAIHILGRESILEKGTRSCEPNAGKVPCYMLEMPRDEKPCQMVNRLIELFDYVSASCNHKFQRRLSEALHTVRKSSMPADGTSCFGDERSVISLKLANKENCSLSRKLREIDQDPIEKAAAKFMSVAEGDSGNFATRITRRYENILKFIVDASYSCISDVVRCSDFESVFGESEEDMESLLETSLRMAQSLEETCPDLTFAEYFATIGGKVNL